MDYKLIAMDFDGTLLNDKKEVTERTKNILMECKKSGYKIVGVTARHLESSRIVVPLDLFDFVILNNGVCLYDVLNDCYNYLGFIDKSRALEITKKVESVSKQIDFVSITTYYTYLIKKNSKLSFIKDIDDINEINEPIARMNIFFKNQNDVSYYHNLISNNYNDVNCFIMQDSKVVTKHLVVNPIGISKVSTLKLLGDNLNISLDSMIFFGDGLNDLDVMNAVGCSVAMEEALDEVKQQADYITTSNNNDGIAEFIKKYLKIV